MHETNLRLWRETNKLTQQALADELGVSRQTIVNWECSHIELPKMLQLAIRGLDVSGRGVALDEAEASAFRSRPHEPGSGAARLPSTQFGDDAERPSKR